MDDLLKELKEKEGITLDGLNFYNFFNDEAQIGCSWSKNLEGKRDITVEDIITSAIQG